MDLKNKKTLEPNCNCEPCPGGAEVACDLGRAGARQGWSTYYYSTDLNPQWESAVEVKKQRSLSGHNAKGHRRPR